MCILEKLKNTKKQTFSEPKQRNTIAAELILLYYTSELIKYKFVWTGSSQTFCNQNDREKKIYKCVYMFMFKK